MQPPKRRRSNDPAALGYVQNTEEDFSPSEARQGEAECARFYRKCTGRAERPWVGDRLPRPRQVFLINMGSCLAGEIQDQNVSCILGAKVELTLL